MWFEYSNGYLVLNPYCGDVEVWRCSAESQDVDESSCQVTQEAKPTVRQLTASAAAAAKYGTSPSRGNFLPWARIQRPELGGFARFSFPFLGVITSEEINIWDVRTGVLVQTMLDIQRVNYIDGDVIVSADDDGEEFWCLGEVSDFNLTERYVFVCGTDSLRVFDRDVRGVVGTGRDRAVSAEDISPHNAFARGCFTVATDDSGKVIQKHHLGGVLVAEHETVLMNARYEGSAEFLAGECLDGHSIDVFCRTWLSRPLSYTLVSNYYSQYLILWLPCGDPTIRRVQNPRQTILRRWLFMPHPVGMEYVRG